MTKVLKTAELGSSTWYSYRARKSAEAGRPAFPSGQGRPCNTDNLDEKLLDAVSELKKEPFMGRIGYRKLVHYLLRDKDIKVNHKRLYRLVKAAGLLAPKKKKTKRRGRKVCVSRKVTAPNQLWEFDLKYGYIHGENCHFYVMAFIDVFSRKVQGYHIGKSCKAKDLCFTLAIAIEEAGADTSILVIRSDNGTQMTSHQFQNEVLKLGLEHEFIPPGEPNKNAHIESFFSIADYEFFDSLRVNTFAEAYEATVEYINFYNSRRIHGSLNNMTPDDYTNEFFEGKNLAI